VAGHPNLETIAAVLLSLHVVLVREFKALEQQVRALARANAMAKLLMSTPAVGPIVALTYASAIDDPARFTSSKQVGPHFGLTPRKYKSGQTGHSGRISKKGDALVRRSTRPRTSCSPSRSRAAQRSRVGRCGSPAGRHEEGQSGACAQACGDHASHARQRHTLQRRGRGSLTGRNATVFGWATTSGPLEAKSLRRDDGSGQAACTAVTLRLRGLAWAGLILFTPHIPSGGGLAPTPYRKHDPGERMTQKRDC